MLRFGILASAVPLLLAGLFAHSELLPGPRPCIEAGGSSLQIAEAPWHADLHVTFTDFPATATVRVQIVENAETADFVMVDGADSLEANACGGAPRFVAISAYPDGIRTDHLPLDRGRGRLPDFCEVEDVFAA